MNAWTRTDEARARRRRVARVLVFLSVCGEALVLWHVTARADYASAYLIVAAWMKDTIHKMVDGSAAATPLAGGSGGLTTAAQPA